jgi:hypothetical protein
LTTLPEHLDHPAFQVKCLTCEMLRQDVDQCAKYKCCWAYARRGHEQRLKDDARLAEDRAREEGGSNRAVYAHAHAGKGDPA